MGIPILGPARSGPIFGGNSVSMVSDGSLEDEDSTRPPNMIVKWAEDSSRRNGDHSHSELSAFHPIDLWTQIDCRKQLNGYPSCLWNDLVVVQGGLR